MSDGGDGEALMAFAVARLDEREAGAKDYLLRLNQVHMENANTLQHRLAVDAFAYWDDEPARLLWEIGALRAILAVHAEDQYGCQKCCGPCREPSLVAAIWSDHPDYQEAWRP